MVSSQDDGAKFRALGGRGDARLEEQVYVTVYKNLKVERPTDTH